MSKDLFVKSVAVAVILCLFTNTGICGDSIPPNGKIASTGHWIHEKVQEIPYIKVGPFTKLPDGSILTVEKTNCFISSDEGRSWKVYPIFNDPAKFDTGPGLYLTSTPKNIVILAFINGKEKMWNWQADISDSPGAKLPTYVVRSLDGGKTWQTPQKLHDDWTGAIRDMIVTTEGNIVFTSMMMMHDPGRHTVLTYTSKDDGASWIRSNIIDMGGVGTHGGVTEATLVQLKDGRLWKLIRTNWGQFLEAFSQDEGLTWKAIQASNIDASCAPGQLERLKSGRLVLVWNREFPEGKNSYPLTGGDDQWSDIPVSNHREELSMMFSNDDGKSWTKPVVIARLTDKIRKQRELSYPFVFEANPGEIWVTVWRFNGPRMRIYETDFFGRKQFISKSPVTR